VLVPYARSAIVSLDRIGVRYGRLTEEGRRFARENDFAIAGGCCSCRGTSMTAQRCRDRGRVLGETARQTA